MVSSIERPANLLNETHSARKIFRYCGFISHNNFKAFIRVNVSKSAVDSPDGFACAKILEQTVKECKKLVWNVNIGTILFLETHDTFSFTNNINRLPGIIRDQIEQLANQHDCWSYWKRKTSSTNQHQNNQDYWLPVCTTTSIHEVVSKTLHWCLVHSINMVALNETKHSWITELPRLQIFLRFELCHNILSYNLIWKKCYSNKFEVDDIFLQKWYTRAIQKVCSSFHLACFQTWGISIMGFSRKKPYTPCWRGPTFCDLPPWNSRQF